MASVSIRDLRNHGGDVIDRVAGGESVVITRDGVPVAELHALSPQSLDAETILKRWRSLPSVDPESFRRDLDSVLDPSL
jgi:prevent-host-death family protein